ncbi:MAG TPA: glycosyltransferase [Chloroflexota bacterium]|jgi:alpha/beta superfamily hydrolase
MAQLLSAQEQRPGLPPPAYERGSPAAGRTPVTMRVDGDAVYGTLYEPTPNAAQGRRVGVLILEQVCWHRMHHRLAQHLAAAGYYALTFDFRGRGESAGGNDDDMWRRHHAPVSMLADTRQAIATFRDVVPLDKVIGYAYCQAVHVLSACAVVGALDGLIGVGATIIDDYFRQNYRGVLSGLPDIGSLPEFNMFEHLTEYDGPMLFVYGEGDLFLNASPLPNVLQQGEAWEAARPARAFELCTVKDGDHTFSSRPTESVVIEQALQWLDRRFGRGYPYTWQGLPPSLALPDGPERDASPAVQVPMLTTGALLHAPDPYGPAEQPGWRMELPDGRAFALTDALRRLVALVDGHRTVGEMAARLGEEMGRPVRAEQISTLLHERLAPLGVLTPDARGEGGEDESGMTDVLIRCYEPGDKLRALLDNLTRVTRSPYNVILVVGRRHAAANQNRALDRARTRYAVFLDDDVLLTEGWLERLRETMDRTGAGAVSGRQLGMDSRALYTSAGCPEGAIVEAPIGGTCFMFRNDLGLRFDEAYVRSQWDDVDFMYQLYERGYKTYVDGRVTFYHHAEGKIWRNQNLMYFDKKWQERKLLQGWVAHRYSNGHIVTLMPSRARL